MYEYNIFLSNSNIVKFLISHLESDFFAYVIVFIFKLYMMQSDVRRVVLN